MPPLGTATLKAETWVFEGEKEVGNNEVTLYRGKQGPKTHCILKKAFVLAYESTYVIFNSE